MYSSPLIFRQRRAWWNISQATLSVRACFWWNGGLQNTALKRNGSTPDSALLIINSQRSSASGMFVSTFRRLEATAIGDSSLNTTLASGFFASSVRPITPLPQPRSTISPSRFSGRCSIKKRAPISRPVREKTFAWLWMVQSVPSSFQLSVSGASASSGAANVQLIRRAFFQASVVVVGPRTFSNSSSVEV